MSRLDLAQGRSGTRRYIDRTACRARLARASVTDHSADAMNIHLTRALRIAAFVLATLAATSALVAAGLNDDAATPAAQVR